MKNEIEYFTPITGLNSESDCEEIVEGYKEIIEEYEKYSRELEEKRAGIDEEDYYQDDSIDIEIYLREIEKEIDAIIQLIFDKNCEESVPNEIMMKIDYLRRK